MRLNKNSILWLKADQKDESKGKNSSELRLYRERLPFWQGDAGSNLPWPQVIKGSGETLASDLLSGRGADLKSDSVTRAEASITIASHFLHERALLMAWGDRLRRRHGWKSVCVWGQWDFTRNRPTMTKTKYEGINRKDNRVYGWLSWKRSTTVQVIFYPKIRQKGHK